MNSRREFLKYLAASPLLTEYSAFAQEVEETLGARLTDPSDVINVFEMEARSRERKSRPLTLATFRQVLIAMQPCVPTVQVLLVFKSARAGSSMSVHQTLA